MTPHARGPPAPGIRPFTRVVLPIEGTDREFLAQQAAVHLAASMGVPVFAVHLDDGRSRRGNTVFAFVEQEAHRWGVGIEARNVLGTDPVEGILAEVGALDLIVIGTRHMGSRYHLGSVAVQLVERAPCPVMVLRLPK